MSDYSSNFPQQRPTLNLDFANSGKLDSRLSYSRSSGGTYLSNEKSLNSENLLLQSQDFDTTWANDGGVGLTASQTAPDGTSTAWLLTASSGSSISPRLSQPVSITSPTKYTTTVHVKAGTASHAYVSLRGAASNFAYAQLEFASPSSVTTGGAGFTSISGTVTALGGSWYKLTLTATSSSSSSAFSFIGLSDGTAFSGSGYPNWSPAGTETLYAWGAQLSSTNSKVYDSPTTTQISRKYSPLLKTAAANAPRFEYAADGQSEGLLIEQQFTQYAHYSEEFDNNGGWAKYNATIQPNAAVAPDGSLSADLLVEAYETSGTNSHYMRQNTLGSVAVGDTYTWTVFAKAAGRNYATIYTTVGGANTYGIWNLLDGSVTTTSGSGSFSSSDCGNGWYRLQITFTTTTTSGGSTYFYTALDASTFGYAGNGYGSVLYWGANLTKTASSMSYLKAEATTVTKSADSCSVADFGYTGGPISITAEANTSDVSSASKILFRYDGGDVYTNYFQGSLLVNYVTAGASTQALQYPSSVTAGTDYKVASRVDTNSINSAANGTAQAADTSAVLPDLAGATLHIGGISGSQCLNGNLKNLKVFSAPLTDTNLTALTS